MYGAINWGVAPGYRGGQRAPLAGLKLMGAYLRKEAGNGECSARSGATETVLQVPKGVP